MQFVTDHAGMTVESIKPRGGIPQPNGTIAYEAGNPHHDPGEPTLHFERYSVTPKHHEFADKHFRFSGLPVNPDTDEPDRLAKVIRVGVLDTDRVAKLRGWTDERKAEVERLILANEDHGSLYRVYEVERVPAPWPTYDEMRGGRGRGNTAAQEILEFAVTGGYDLALVIEYEEQNRNREDVIAALREKMNEVAEQKIEVTA